MTQGAKYFAEKLHKERKSKRLTQAELAELCDTHQKAISQWECNKQQASANDICEVARALHMSPREFLPNE